MAEPLDDYTTTIRSGVTPVPAFGYWATYILITALASLAGAIHGGMRIKVKNDV